MLQVLFKKQECADFQSVCDHSRVAVFPGTPQSRSAEIPGSVSRAVRNQTVQTPQMSCRSSQRDFIAALHSLPYLDPL